MCFVASSGLTTAFPREQAPETVFPDAQGHFRQTDSTADMWSLGKSPSVVQCQNTRQQADLQGDLLPGLILHKMLFFRLPYNHDDSFSELEREIATYAGCVIG
jgi:hypothetical protein